MQFIPESPMTAPIVGGGKDHNSGIGPHITPMAPGGLIKSFKSRSVFNKNAHKPTDVASSEDDVFDLSTIHVAIPFKVPRHLESFVFPESCFMFVIDPGATIRGSSSAFYDVRGIAALNDYLMRIHHEGYSNRAAGIISTASGGASVDPNLDPAMMARETLDMTLMDINAIAEKVFFLGFQKSVYTNGKPSSAAITKSAGGSLCTFVHEGRIEAPNVWGDVATGGHVGFALTKFEPIHTKDPHKLRAHQLIPVTCGNGVGFGLYPQYGIEVYDEAKFNKSQKRSRMDSQLTLGSGPRKENAEAWVGSYSSHLQAGKYHPNSLIINADKYRHRTVDGTIFSLNRHEVSMRPHKPGSVPNAKSVPDTFLDWSCLKFGINYTNPESTGLLQNKDVYGANLWMISMVQAVHYPVGAVWTAARGGRPSQATIDEAILRDHEQDSKALNMLFEKNKITLQVRVQN